MDYQIVPKTHNHHQHFMFVVSLLIISTLPRHFCIVNRDLVLTPKQGLQLSGKRIFYDEENSSHDTTAVAHHNDSVAALGTRPWERTLKHVTYLTLFTNAANGIITGNFSKVKEYNDFLTSEYVRSPKPIDSRFGDIVTLAQGRLETMPNGSYRFMEGNCDYECARENKIVAMWHVQKIRHRDTADRKYHYEMKFSVSPINAKAPTETVVRGGPNKRTIMEERRNNVQTFIQKEDDYPHSFRKFATDKDEDFLEKRYDAARNFRHVSPHYQQQQVTPIPQSTFLRGVFQQPPAASMPLQPQPNRHQRYPLHALPQTHHNNNKNPHQQQHQQQQLLSLPERLNIGEFYKGNYAPKSASKVELFPNLLNMFMGKPQHSLPPPSTTFQPPAYQMKFPRPEIYTLQQHHHHQLQDLAKFAEYQQLPLSQSQEQFNQRAPSSSAPIVTHHYHHHFFMPNNSAITIEQALQQSGEQNSEAGAELYHNDVTELVTPQGYVTNIYDTPQSTTTFRQQHFALQPPYHAANQQQNLQPNYFSNYHVQQIVPPAPQKFVFANAQIEPQRVMHVTSTPPLKKPQYTLQHQQAPPQQEQLMQQQQQPQQQLQLQNQLYETRPFTTGLEYTTVHVPLLISYPAPINGEKSPDVPTPRNKPFLQSDRIEDATRYSEPDPLYVNVNEQEINKDKHLFSNAQYSQEDIDQEPQLEPPDHYDQANSNQQPNTEEADNRKEHSESVEAQLPPPNDGPHAQEAGKGAKHIKQKFAEQSDIQSSTIAIELPNENSTTKNIKTEAPNSISGATKTPKVFALRHKRINLRTGTTTSSTSTTNRPTTLQPSKPPISSPTTASKPRKTFSNNSSTESPLRTISRYRNSYARTSSTSTTTTEKPVLKWTPKRQINHSKSTTSSTPADTDGEEDELDETDKSENDTDESEDFRANESNNLRIPKSSALIDFNLQPTTEISNTISASINSSRLTTTTPIPPPPQSQSSSAEALATPSPHLSQTFPSVTEIYEILTQKSVSKSVSLKVGTNGEEIPVIVDEVENEVKTT